MKKPMECVLVAAAMTMAFGATSAAEDAPSREARRAIEARSRTFEQCYAKHDAVCVVDGYYVSDDQAPVMSPPGGQAPIRGRAALIENFTKEFAGVQTIRLE